MGIYLLFHKMTWECGNKSLWFCSHGVKGRKKKKIVTLAYKNEKMWTCTCKAWWFWWNTVTLSCNRKLTWALSSVAMNRSCNLTSTNSGSTFCSFIKWYYGADQNCYTICYISWSLEKSPVRTSGMILNDIHEVFNCCVVFADITKVFKKRWTIFKILFNSAIGAIQNNSPKNKNRQFSLIILKYSILILVIKQCSQGYYRVFFI